jgi:hypothetical protein
VAQISLWWRTVGMWSMEHILHASYVFDDLYTWRHELDRGEHQGQTDRRTPAILRGLVFVRHTRLTRLRTAVGGLSGVVPAVEVLRSVLAAVEWRRKKGVWGSPRILSSSHRCCKTRNGGSATTCNACARKCIHLMLTHLGWLFRGVCLYEPGRKEIK